MAKKEKISYIFPNDLSSLEVDENGNYLVPEGFEIYRVVDDTLERIADLEKQLENMGGEPTDEDLIAEGRVSHPYYIIKEEIDYLKSKL